MSVIIQGYQLREIAFGVQVIKSAQTPPNSGASATLFTVAGGAVIVTQLLGRVHTVLSGSTGALALGSKPTVGTEETAGIATAGVVGGAEAGSWLTVPAASTGLAGALTANTHAGNAVYLPNPFIVSAGTIEVTTSIATMTGSIDWYLAYLPLDTGASVS
jgi:hypothetical protein